MASLLNTLVAALSAFLMAVEDKTATTEDPLPDPIVVTKELITEKSAVNCCIVQ